MVRKRVLVPLLAAAALLVVVGFAFLVVPFVFEIPCPAGPEDRGSSPAPIPGPAAAGGGEGEDEDDVACLRVSRAVLRCISFLVGALTGCACVHCYYRFADGDDEEGDAAGAAAKKAGYVAIADDDPEAGAKN